MFRLSKLLILLSVVVLWGHVTKVEAAGKPSKKITRASRVTKAQIRNFREGHTLNNISPFYSATNDTLTVVGRFTKVPASIKDSQLRVIVSGVDISTIAGASISVQRSKKRKTKYMKVGFSVALPAPDLTLWPMLDVVVELVYKKTDQVLARERLSLYDLRDRDASASADPTAGGVNLSVQLSNPGIGNGEVDQVEGLEIPVLSNSPYPSLEDFNTRLADAASRSPTQAYRGMVQDFDTCVKITDLEEDRFSNRLQFPALNVALLEAETLYLAYLAVQSGTQACGIAAPLCKLILDGAACVQSTPQVSDFELCIDTIVGKPHSLSVGAMSDLQLGFLNSSNSTAGTIEADIELSEYNGLVDGRLQDFVVRWRYGGCAESLKPLAYLDNEKLFELSWLNEWSQCRDMQLDFELATTKSRPQNAPQYNVTRDPDSSNRLYVSDHRLAGFELFDKTSEHAKGSCGIQTFAPGAAAYLELFTEQLSVILEQTWNESAPNTQMAQLLDLLFRPFAVGDVELPYHTINARVDSVRSSAQGGMLVDWSTLVSPTEEESFSRLKTTLFANSQGPAVQSQNALDAQNRSFDSSYGVTLNFVNKVLWARAAGPELNQPIVFETNSGSAGGVGSGLPGFGGIPGGLPPVSSQYVSGDYLATLHPGFRELKGKDYEFVLSRVLDPFMFMPEDPSQQVPGVGLPVRYGINSLRILLKEKDRIKDGKVAKVGKTYIDFDASFVDESFFFSFDEEPGSQLLESELSDANWQINVRDMNLVQCPMFSHGQGVQQNNSCERGLEEAVNLLLRDKLTSIFGELVDDIPAPQFFNSEGVALTSVQSDEQSKFQFDGRVTLFGQYVP